MSVALIQHTLYYTKSSNPQTGVLVRHIGGYVAQVFGVDPSVKTCCCIFAVSAFLYYDEILKSIPF